MSSTVSLTINNTSGIDLVIAFLQGGTPNQTVDTLNWLNLSATPVWEVPKKPTSNKDLLPYMTDVKKDDSITIDVPSYLELVGFRCLVAESAYKNNALQTLNIKNPNDPDNPTKINYMAFPNLKTAKFAFDKFEAGLTTGTPGIWNITSVDFLGIPLQLTKGTTTVGYRDGVTAHGMFEILAKLDSPYNSGLTNAPNTKTDTYRFFSPAHIKTADTCLDKQIKDGLKVLQSNSCEVKYGGDTFSDFTASCNTPKKGEPIVGTVSCTSTLANGTVTVDNLTTVNSFAGTVGIKGVNNSTVVLGALLATATCRGVLGNPKNWGDIIYPTSQCATPWNYYPKGGTFDEYSKIIHQYSIDGKNYGFSYDDYFADEAGYNVLPGESVTLTVLPIKGKMSILPNPIPTPKTGCLAITIPSGITTNIGSMVCNEQNLDSVSNILCFLDDKIIISFSNAPKAYTNPEIRIDLTATTQTDAISYWENGKANTKLSISGLAYNPNIRQLTFGQTSAWNLAT